MIHNQYTIELLAPAKNLESAVAAIDYGADAVYMGAAKFGARHAAGNAAEDIARAVEYARRYGVRVYAALNTVLFENELEEARRQAQEVIAAGVDALIVQDMAYMEMGLGGVEFHASTQTFNADPVKVKFLQGAGFSRVILERNLTLAEIRNIRAAATVELEAFVHGAICVCHSGRCYMSRTMSARSGNRGECSQPCRLTYDLLEPTGGYRAWNAKSGLSPEGINRGGRNAVYDTLMAGKHLLSVQDLDLSERIGDLLDAGITSFKIEGRLKGLDYIKNTVACYRSQLDREIAAHPHLRKASAGTVITDFAPDLSKTFTRGRSEYFLDGKRRGVASFDTPKAVGEYMGHVSASGRGWIESEGAKTLAAGDGICFFADGELAGMNVNRTEGDRIYTNRDISPSKGTELFRNFDRRFSAAIKNSRTRRVIEVRGEASITPDTITLTLTDEEGVTAMATAHGLFEPASDPEMAEQAIRAQLSKSGDTIFRIAEIGTAGDGTVRFVPISALNSLRREALGKLLSARLARVPERNIPVENPGFPYPATTLLPTENVTNSLAERFYRRHGVERIEAGLDTRESMHGEAVMRTPYCIRRETGRCAKSRKEENTDLFLRRGTHLYRLRFDCADCMMVIIFE